MKPVNVIQTKFKPQTSFHDPSLMIADGGVIGRNPSVLGGTYACKLISDGKTIFETSGLIFPEELGVESITNNHSELYALLSGLILLPWKWRGTIWSDSKVSLMRMFCGASMNNVPYDLINRLENHKARLVHWDQIQYGLLDGHPTREQLVQGFGKRGHPVHEANCWADKECGRLASEFLRKRELQLTSRERAMA
jgi:ribonuclease HI